VTYQSGVQLSQVILFTYKILRNCDNLGKPGLLNQKGQAPLLIKTLREILSHIPDNNIGIRDRALINFGWASAMRRSEIISLNWGNITLKWLYFSGQVLYKDFNLKEYYHDKEKEFLFA
jgi:integrase